MRDKLALIILVHSNHFLVFHFKHPSRFLLEALRIQFSVEQVLVGCAEVNDRCRNSRAHRLLVLAVLFPHVLRDDAAERWCFLR